MADSELTDPLERSLVLYDRTWFGHIVPGHPEVREHRGLVEKAVVSPEQVRYSSSDINCRLYFAPGPRSGVKMMVVGDVSSGVVKTAHLAKKITGGAVEWSK